MLRKCMSGTTNLKIGKTPKCDEIKNFIKKLFMTKRSTAQINDYQIWIQGIRMV